MTNAPATRVHAKRAQATRVPPLLARAVDSHQAGDLAAAERLYREVLAADPEQGDALKLLGVICGQEGRHHEATALLERAVRARPEDAAAHYNLGTVHRENGALEAAIAAFEGALRLAPANASAAFNLGATLLDLDRTDEAVAAFDRAVQADPDHDRARHQLGLIHLTAGRPAKAAAHWEAATRLDAACAPAWCNLGVAHRRSGDSAAAVPALERAIALAPDLGSAHSNLALAALDVADLDTALRSARRALEIDPEDARAHRAMARVMLVMGEIDTAEAHWRDAERLAPDMAAVATERGDVLRRLGRLAKAEAAYGRALDLDPGEINADVGRVTLLQMRGERDEAVRAAEAILARHPDAVPALYATASAYLETGRTAEAARLLERGVAAGDLTRNQARMLLFRLGDARDQLGEHDAAWAAYAQANQLKGARFDRAAFVARVEGVRSAFDRARLEAIPRAAAGALRPIFIAGMPRSGSTLLEQVLASHPEVTGGGELCVMERMENHLARLTGLQAPYPQCAAELTPASVGALAAFVGDALAGAADGRWRATEKSVSNFLYLGLVDRLLPRARVVACVRDPLDTCLSRFFHDFAGALPHTYDLEDVGFFLRRHDELMAHWRETLDIPVLTVRYEDLVEDQEATTRELLAFCGLPWDDACLSFHENRRVVHTLSAEQVRRPLYSSSVGRWRHYEPHLAPLREALGARDS